MAFSDELLDEDLALVQLGQPNLFVRLKVLAEPGRDVARNVQVLLLRVERPISDRPAPVVPSRNLKWADTPNEKLDIPAGIWRRVDFLNLWYDADAENPHALLPMLYQYDEPWPPHPRTFLTDPGVYRAVLVIAVDNADSTFWTVEFEYRPEPVSVLEDLCDQLRILSIEPGGAERTHPEAYPSAKRTSRKNLRVPWPR